MKALPALAVSALFSALPATSHAATELIVNGGFEQEMAGWSCTTHDLCYTDNWSAPHNGELQLYAYDNTGVGLLSQSFSTVVGAVYTLSFWYKWSEPDTAPNQAWWSAGDVLNGTISRAPGEFTQLLATFVATSETTTLGFNFRTEGGTGVIALDDISVTEGNLPSPVPLPASAALLGMGLTGLAALRRRARS